MSGTAESYAPVHSRDALNTAVSTTLSSPAPLGAGDFMSLAQALQTYPQLTSLPDGGTIVSTATHRSWWVHFSSAPPATVTSLLAHIRVGWGYSATPPYAQGAEAGLNPATMTEAQLIRAGLPLPPLWAGHLCVCNLAHGRPCAVAASARIRPCAHRGVSGQGMV